MLCSLQNQKFQNVPYHGFFQFSAIFQSVVQSDCHQAITIVQHHANGCFDWLIYGQKSVNPSREAASALSWKYKRFTFVYQVHIYDYVQKSFFLIFQSCQHYSYIEASFIFQSCQHYSYIETWLSLLMQT